MGDGDRADEAIACRIGHSELTRPMTSTIGICRQLLARRYDRATERKLVELLREEVRQLERLIEGTFGLSPASGSRGR
jgi:hypothetical protein